MMVNKFHKKIIVVVIKTVLLIIISTISVPPFFSMCTFTLKTHTPHIIIHQ